MNIEASSMDELVEKYTDVLDRMHETATRYSNMGLLVSFARDVKELSKPTMKLATPQPAFEQEQLNMGCGSPGCRANHGSV